MHECSDEDTPGERTLIQVQNIIDRELGIIKNSGDAKLNVISEGLQKEELDNELEFICNGYLKLDTKDLCSENAFYLYLDAGSDKHKHFCKATHLVRYLIVHYCAHGKAKAKQKESSSKQTITSTNKD